MKHLQYLLDNAVNLFFSDALDNVDGFVSDSIRVFGSHIFDVHTTLGRGNDDRTLHNNL